jgi:hypothetical protein
VFVDHYHLQLNSSETLCNGNYVCGTSNLDKWKTCFCFSGIDYLKAFHNRQCLPGYLYLFVVFLLIADYLNGIVNGWMSV